MQNLGRQPIAPRIAITLLSPAAFVNLGRTMNPLLSGPTRYHSIVGALQYLILTRPDLFFAINQIAQHIQSPTKDHWITVKCICII